MAKISDTQSIPVECSKCKNGLTWYRITNYSKNGFPMESIEIEPCKFCINKPEEMRVREEGFYWVVMDNIKDQNWQMAEYSCGDFTVVGYSGIYKEENIKFISERLIPPEQKDDK